ncbi:Ankyrin repeat domain-containing protein 39 [Lobosporangium transversale]|uniref:Ankyrin repeat-containing domain protein n=1 Tax=Lobosporangium transversale TaxID=64571 RepID=A0A1Y2GXI3_9FUNG|nr:ankyrin repeat-containing domain protein [Lobosporangium transversale]KAF9913569.1 Ankyrin repeat domain-containing protein 39 [Lobosporangium transversale]ORZ26975.1 ankyrin repeat-containing domain protein [Lobosporangium transversale]|eukprot:XP_021884722.1 ankyrin repeat-containing domain protein [Lobosporangium transversale]
MFSTKECHDHNQPGHVCNHGISATAESLDEMDFSRSIHAACLNNNAARVQTILSKTIRGGISPANALDPAGYTALHYASRAGNKEICSLLLNAGADYDIKTPELGTTPLMRAIQQSHLDIARLLVSYGASVEAVNTNQENVFHILAIAAKNRINSSSNKGNHEAVATVNRDMDMARWLKIKVKDQFGPERLAEMLQARDLGGQTPLECLNISDQNQEALSALSALSALLTVN